MAQDNQFNKNSFRLPLGHRATVLWLVVALLSGAGCRQLPFLRSKPPATLAEVQAVRLAYQFQPDIKPPATVTANDDAAPAPAIKTVFENTRREQLLARTAVSPDNQRILAVYATADEPANEYRIDLFASDGRFLRNVTPSSLAVVFPDYVNWSPDGQHISFLARKSSSLAANKIVEAEAAPTPPPVADATPGAPDVSGGSATPTPATNNGPIFAPIQALATEQVYLADRDGYNIKPLTNREGLIYFFAEWAPDSHALAALACREHEWNAREQAARTPVGRPRRLSTNAQEIILSDALVEAFPVWSPDSSKIAVGFDTEIEIYDAATAQPTRARLSLRPQLWQASQTYDQKAFAASAANANNPAAPVTPNAAPASYQPFVRLAWPDPKTLYAQTAFVRSYATGPVNNFPRWHLLTFAPQPNAAR